MRENLVDPKEVKVDYRLPENTTPVKVKMAKVLRDMDSVKPGKEPRSRG
jgi:nucleolar protein 4